MKVKDIQQGKNLQEEIELASAILHQNKHEAQNLDVNINADKTIVKDNNFVWAERQYPIPNPLVFKAFLTNSVCLLVKTIDVSESKGVDCSYKNSFVAITIIKKHKYFSLEPAIMTQLEK